MLQTGEVILALKVLGVHRHYRNTVLLRQLCGNGIVIIADYLNYAGGDEHYTFRLIFRHYFFEGLCMLSVLPKVTSWLSSTTETQRPAIPP